MDEIGEETGASPSKKESPMVQSFFKKLEFP